MPAAQLGPKVLRAVIWRDSSSRSATLPRQTEGKGDGTLPRHTVTGSSAGPAFRIPSKCVLGLEDEGSARCHRAPLLSDLRPQPRGQRARAPRRAERRALGSRAGCHPHSPSVMFCMTLTFV